MQNVPQNFVSESFPNNLLVLYRQIELQNLVKLFKWSMLKSPMFRFVFHGSKNWKISSDEYSLLP